MKIGLLGAGDIGGTLARLLVGAGHEVVVSNSRGPDSLAPLAAELGARASGADIATAAAAGEVVVLAVPWRAPEALPPPEAVRGKIVVDAMNPYRLDGGLFDLGDSTSSEETLRRLPGARLMKAFNTIWWKHLAENSRPDLPSDARQAIYLAGDDAEAKAVVAGLIEDIGFAPVDTGSLRDGGRRQEPGSDIYDVVLTGAEARALLAG